MFYRFLIVLLLIFINTSHGVSQQKKLLFSVEENSRVQKKFVKDYGVQIAYFFYQGEFSRRGIISKEVFLKSIDKRIPNKSENGFAVIDWEGVGFQSLINQKDRKFNDYIAEYLEIIRIAKKARPNIKWAFYGFPIRNFWSTDAVWRKKSLNLGPIYKAQDFVSPSLYLFYLNKEVEEDKQKNYFVANTKLALEIGAKYNKPVYPIIWQRVHDSNPNSGHKNIDKQYFEYYISTILNTSYQSKSVSGLIWWQAEEYQMNKFSAQKNVKKEYSGITDTEKYHRKIFSEYYYIIKSLLNKK